VAPATTSSRDALKTIKTTNTRYKTKDRIVGGLVMSKYWGGVTYEGKVDEDDEAPAPAPAERPKQRIEPKKAKLKLDKHRRIGNDYTTLKCRSSFVIRLLIRRN